MSLRELEPLLAPLAHGEQALAHVRDLLEKLSPEERLKELAENLVRLPLTHEAAQERLGKTIDDRFHVLQGDIVRTDAAYLLGQRLVGNSYVIATSSCDLVPRRRQTTLLMPVEPRRRSQYPDRKKLNDELSQLTLFKPKKYFYLPALHDDDDDVLFNVVRLDPFAQCANTDVNLAERRASLTLVGWRLFAALARELLIREADEEAAMRREPPTILEISA